MTHVGQELALGMRRGFGSCFGLLQCRFGVLALRDVFDNPFVVEERSAGITNRACRLGNPDYRTIAAINLGLKSRHRTVCLQQASKLGAPRGVDIELSA